MARFRIVIQGRYYEPIDQERWAGIIDDVRKFVTAADTVRDEQAGSFEFILEANASTENEAQAYARASVVSALFDAGLSIKTATVDDIETRTLH